MTIKGLLQIVVFADAHLVTFPDATSPHLIQQRRFFVISGHVHSSHPHPLPRDPLAAAHAPLGPKHIQLIVGTLLQLTQEQEYMTLRFYEDDHKRVFFQRGVAERPNGFGDFIYRAGAETMQL